jgi:shikimate kinase
MGCGKTTLGRLLSQEWQCPFIDIDQEIERHTGRSVATWLRREGEEGFRRIELQTLQDVSRRRSPRQVVATGGGVVETPAAEASLRRFDVIVWLRADPEQCVARLGAARQARPLLDDDRWRRRWHRRQPLYERLAQVVVDTGDRSVQESFKELLAVLDKGVDPGELCRGEG